MSTFKTLLKAGGLVPLDADVPGETTDEVHARAFTHPALGDRPVVRLSPAALAPGEDAEMAFLGFEPGTDHGAVGRRRRRALGFPGWALVHDPARARFALEVVQSLKKALRQVASKPGYAKEAIDEIGERLGRSVPHFLPSFYEEAGRGFLGAGNATYAAQYFEKSREAERVHGLKVDEAQRRETVLEFALAGAVSIKSLQAYAKDLKKDYTPAEAYAHFRELSVRRTAGGMPPWAGMAKELRGLSSASGLNAAAEDEGVLREIIDCPALKKAPMGFWKDFQKPLIRLAKSTPAVVATLLDLLPEPSGQANDFAAWWLDLLDEAGALDAVAAGEAPKDGAAAWLERLIEWANDQERSLPTQVPNLLRRLADRLKADGKPMKPPGRWGEQWHIALADLALELGIPLKDPEEGAGTDLGRWAEDIETAGLDRDLTFVVADPRFVPMLEEALDSAAGDDDFEKAARGRAGLTEMRRRWLLKLLESVDAAGLPLLGEKLERVGEVTSAETFTEFPEAMPVLEARRVAPALARTLRAGFIDELGWPALEAALAEVGDERWIGGTWPFLIVANRTKILVVGPEGRVLERSWSCPKKAEVKDLRYADGQVLAIFGERWNEAKGLWTSAPKSKFDVEYAWGDVSPGSYAAHLPGGGVCEGNKLLRAGDTERHGRDEVFFDGETIWKEGRGDDGEHGLREYDPIEDKLGRRSLPRFFEAFAAPGYELDFSPASLMPVPAGVQSPFGARDGLVGWRVRAREDGEGPVEYEGIDGRRFVGEVEGNRLVGLLTLPGDETPRPISGERAGRWADAAVLLSPDGSFAASDVSETYIEGSKYVPPHEYWHFFVPRDVEGSKALRSIGDEQAQALLDAAVADLENEADDEMTQLDGALRAQLPAITDATLRAAVAGVVEAAAHKAQELAALLAERHGAESAPAGRVQVAESELREPLEGLGLVGYAWGDSLSAHLYALQAFFSGEETATRIESSSFEWWDLVGQTPAIAWRAAFAWPEEHREVLTRLLDLWSDLEFLDRPVRICTYKGKIDASIAKPRRDDDEDGWRPVVHDGRRYLVELIDPEYDDETKVIEQAGDDGAFAALPGAKMTEENRLPAETMDRAALRAFVEAQRAKGRVAWGKAEVEQLAQRTGLTVAEAALLLPGFAWCQSSYQSNFLPKEFREAMGLKLKEASAARDSLLRVDVADRRAIVTKALGADPWDGAALERLAAAVNEKLGQRVSLPPEVLAAANDLIDEGDAAAFLTAFVAPAKDDCFAVDGDWKMDTSGSPECAREGAFDGAALEAAARLVPHLFAERPVGDPFRAGIPQIVERVRARLANPKLLFGGLRVEAEYDDDDDKMTKAVRALLDGFGGQEITIKSGKRKCPGRDTGAVVAVMSDDYGIDFAVRPAQVEDIAAVERMAGDRPSVLRALAFVRSPGFAAMAARVAETPVAAGGFEADPRQSAPALVQEVMAARGLGEDAATLYLQTLALSAPTTANVRTWNGWTAARYGKAAEALVAAGLLIEAKRKRAGRNHFLPGGWEAWSHGSLPMETWKLLLYGIETDPATEAQVVPLDKVLPLEPLHTLFERAWRRIESGDAPRYEEVR